MNERRRILSSDVTIDAVTLRITTTDGSTNVGIEMVVTNGSDVYPVTTDSQGKAVITGLSGGCTIDCETHVLDVTQFTATGTMTVSISAYVDTFPVGEVRTFGYTATVAEVPVVPGTYKMQVWGAQGGSGSGYTGGKGGYSEGIVTIPSAMTLYVFVGGQGSSSGNGGWNGGGGSSSGYSSYNSGGDNGYSYFGCGGGATDISTVTSTMSYSSYRTARSDASLLARMIVAGGGSGGSYAYRSYTSSSTSTIKITSGYFTDGIYVQNDGSVVSNPNRASTDYISLQTGDYVYQGAGSDNYYVPVVFDANKNSLGSTLRTFTATSSYKYVRFVRYNSGSYSSSLTAADPYIQRTTSSTSTSSDYTYGYVGGGVNGGGYSSTYYGQQNSAGSGGAFGLGANQTTTGYRFCGPPAGGGWYGGGNTYADSGIATVKCSGGGSGFVNIAANSSYRPSGYTGLQLDSGATYAGNTSFPNIAGTGNETGHSGNGYAKITRIAAYSVTLRFKDDEDSPVTGASVTVSNSENTYSLTTDSNGEATATMQNGTYNLSCSGYSLNPSQITVSSNTTIDVVAEAPSIMDFSYTGAVQNTTLRAGTYKIECWGAQGGYRSSATYGGKGGYSVGELTLSQNTNIYVYVGGAGNTGGTSGGFNGGGMRATYAGGGGGSDVRIGQDSLYARVIVAGGGGSDGATSKQGIYGGGTTGGTTTQSYGTGGGGGTQTSGGTGSSSASGSGTSGTYGAFGVGGRGYAASSGYAGAGGGGWYGGAGSYPDGSGDDDRGGGGGSGYVYNSSTASNYPSGCLLNSSHYLANSQTIAGNASMPSTSGSTETGHSGNGFVRITKIG